MKRIITDEQRSQIIILSNKGYTNRQIAIETGMKYATLCYWKNKLRNEGIAVLSLIGRPKIKTPAISTLKELEAVNSTDREFNNTQKIRKTSYTKSMLDKMTPEQKDIILSSLSLKYDELEA